MKKIYNGVLFVAFMLFAIYGVGNAEAGGGFFIALLGLIAIMALMVKAGMLDKPVSKEKYNEYYGRKM